MIGYNIVINDNHVLFFFIIMLCYVMMDWIGIDEKELYFTLFSSTATQVVSLSCEIPW